MRIGLDLDGTLYAHPKFFAALIPAMHAAGHEFYCTSAHSRSNWDAAGYQGQPPDRERLLALGIPAELIRPDILHQEPHGDLAIKGRACDQCDVVFDDDPDLQHHTKALVMRPMR